MKLEIYETLTNTKIEDIKDVARFYIEYQKENGKSFWIFIIEKSGKEYAIEYEPKINVIFVKE